MTGRAKPLTCSTMCGGICASSSEKKKAIRAIQDATFGLEHMPALRSLRQRHRARHVRDGDQRLPAAHADDQARLREILPGNRKGHFPALAGLQMHALEPTQAADRGAFAGTGHIQLDDLVAITRRRVPNRRRDLGASLVVRETRRSEYSNVE